MDNSYSYYFADVPYQFIWRGEDIERTVSIPRQKLVDLSWVQIAIALAIADDIQFDGKAVVHRGQLMLICTINPDTKTVLVVDSPWYDSFELLLYDLL